MPSRQSEFASRLDGAALAALAFCFPGIAVLLPLGVVPLVLVVALLAAVAELLSGGRFSRPPALLAVAATLLALWALLSSSWAIDPLWSLQTWARVVPTVVAGGFLVVHAVRQPATRRRRLAGWLLAGFALAITIMVIEGVSGRAINLFLAELAGRAPEEGYRLSRMNRGATALAILAWPAAAALAWRLEARLRWTALLLPLGICLLLAFYSSSAGLVAAAASLAVALPALRAPRLLRTLLLAGTAVAVLAMPLFAKGLSELELAENQQLDFSLRHRVFIWDFVTEAIAEKPIAGWGLDASRDLATPETARFDETHVALPLHPHNVPLQVWLELGIVGLLLGGATLLLAFAGMRRGPPLQAALDAGMVASILVVGCLAYGAWQYHWLVVPLAAAALMRLVPGGAPGAHLDRES